ncbi:unnamed protein product [Spirodela intermedia]|uniref:WAT1-related protein n=1 Tax=Spirodela intermedia TaxID=51605 RepID=A0A7I8IJW6_SPIIN|nr:unnamed protein product [Spirodela intermedia]CAA6657267.1 unnamed protein product [Spirodela intermedia]
MSRVMMKHGPLLGQIYVQVSYAAMFLLSRVVLQQGMNQHLYVFFRQCVASLTITLFVFFLESGRRAKPSLRDVGKISVLALFGITIGQNLYSTGLSLTSTTFATSMNNINPATTFLMALAFRMEKLELWSWRAQAKIWGTILCVGGATIMTVFKGPVVFGSQSPLTEGLSGSSDSDWILGALLLAGSAWSWSAWFTLDCPSQLTSTAVMCWMATLQSGLVALLLVQTPGAWRLSWDLQLLTITYSGIFCSAIGLFVMMWCVKMKGPLFVSVFSPLSTVIPDGDDPGHWGLYCVLWGKASEKEPAGVEEVVAGGGTEASAAEPLLHNGGEERIKV